MYSIVMLVEQEPNSLMYYLKIKKLLKKPCRFVIINLSIIYSGFVLDILSFGPYVKVVSPSDIIEKIKERIKNLKNKLFS